MYLNTVFIYNVFKYYPALLVSNYIIHLCIRFVEFSFLFLSISFSRTKMLDKLLGNLRNHRYRYLTPQLFHQYKIKYWIDVVTTLWKDIKFLFFTMSSVYHENCILCITSNHFFINTTARFHFSVIVFFLNFFIIKLSISILFLFILRQFGTVIKLRSFHN